MNDDDDGDGDDDNCNDDVIEFDAKCQNTITGSCLILIKEKKFDSKKKKKNVINYVQLSPNLLHHKLNSDQCVASNQ